MSFGLLSPSALLLGLLVGLPVLAHLTRRRPTDRIPFGAMLLVQRLVKRLRRRRSLKDIWLLVMRAAAVMLTVLAAAGPELSWQGDVPEFGGSGRVVLVVDTSMSMALSDGGATLFSRARADAAARLASMPDGVQVGLVSFDAEAQSLTPELTGDRARVASLLDTLEPTIHAGDLRGALLEARRLLEGEPGEVLLFSDEAGPVMVPAAADELARLIDGGSAVLPVTVRADPPRNVAITQASYGDGIEGGQLTFRVMNFGPTPLEVACEVRLPDGAEIPVFVDAPAEGETEARVTVPRAAAGGVGRVQCDDPDLVLDDARWFHLPQVGASRVLVVDGDPGDTPVNSEVYFLERALAPWGSLGNGVTPDVVSPKGLNGFDPEAYGLVFLANVSDPRDSGALLRDFVRRGGSLVVAMGDNVTADRYNAALGPILPSELLRRSALADRGEDPILLLPPDTTLSLFEPFRRAGRGAFGRVGAWQVMALEPYSDGGDVLTLMSWEGGVPALVERRVGKGRVLLWTSTFDDAWTNFPFEAAFMPLMQRIARDLGGQGSSLVARLDGIVGERISVALDEGVGDVTVSGAGGAAVRSQVTGNKVMFTPDAPGAYQVSITDGPPVAFVAVNVDPIESDVRQIHSVAAAEAEIDPELFARTVGLAGPSLALAMMLMLMSSVGAALTGGGAR